jgi:hypothetical protein
VHLVSFTILRAKVLAIADILTHIQCNYLYLTLYPLTYYICFLLDLVLSQVIPKICNHFSRSEQRVVIFQIAGQFRNSTNILWLFLCHFRCVCKVVKSTHKLHLVHSSVFTCVSAWFQLDGFLWSVYENFSWNSKFLKTRQKYLALYMKTQVCFIVVHYINMPWKCSCKQNGIRLLG